MSPLIWVFVIDPDYYQSGEVNEFMQAGLSRLLGSFLIDPYLLERVVVTIPARKPYCPPILPLMELGEVATIIHKDELFKSNLDVEHNKNVNIFGALEFAVRYIDSAVPEFLKKSRHRLCSVSFILFTDYKNFECIYDRYRVLNIFRGIFVDLILHKAAGLLLVDELKIIDMNEQKLRELFRLICLESSPLESNSRFINNRIYSIH